MNKAIVIVLHDINFASCYSDQIVALKNGQLVKSDLKDNVIQSSVLSDLYDMDIQIEHIKIKGFVYILRIDNSETL